MTQPAPGPTLGNTMSAAPAARVVPEDDPHCPHPALVRAVEPETPGVATFRIEFQDRRRQETYRIRPGQFNMLYLPGVGEVPISVSVTPDEGPGIGHTIRFVGRVTHAIAALRPGAVIGLRGPYGRGWPLGQLIGRDVLLVAGGLGLAPLRPLVQALLTQRTRYGRLILVYGARQPADLLYQREYPDWQRRGMEVLVTVDRADPSWRGRVGVVPILLQKLGFDPERTVMLTCGPEIMMRFSISEARTDRIGEQDIHLSLERNMHCAVGLCGHCQLGPDFVCKDGPVFSFPDIARFLHQKNF
jgi:NAD(P)H-flavin reductase